MRGASGLIWALLVLGIMAGMWAIMFTKRIYGPNGPDQGAAVFQGAREFDSATRSHLEDLGIKFRPNEKNEPSLNLTNPSDADFAFLENVLAGNSEKGQVSSARVLRDIGAPRSVEPLFAAIKGVHPQDDTFMFECAVTILDAQPPEVRRATLIPAWVNHHADMEPELLAASRVKLRDAGALEQAFLREAAVADRDPKVRRFALDELRQQKRPPLGVIAAAMGDPDNEVRSQARAAMAHRD
jgi:hypothetical protein